MQNTFAPGRTAEPTPGKPLPFPTAEAPAPAPAPVPTVAIPETKNPIVAKALQKNLERMAADGGVPQAAMPMDGPRLATTADEGLNALLAGMRDRHYVYHEVQLPSLGRFYDGTDAPTNGLLHVRPMAGTEEAILSTPQLFRKGQAVNQIFKACVQEPIKPDRLLTADRTALLVYIRAISYGTNYEVEVRCPACQNKIPHTIDLNRDLEACPDDLTPASLVETLPTTGYRVSYRLATGADDVAVNEYAEKRGKNLGNGAVDDTFQYKCSLLISLVEDPTTGSRVTDRNSIRMLLQRMPINDVVHIRNMLNEPPFGMDTKCDVECPVCQERFDIEMPVELNFFFPNTRKKQTR